MASILVAGSGAWVGACSDYGAESPTDAGASASDAGADAAISESEGGRDAASADGANDSSCDVTFCDDFDTPPIGATWTSTDVSGGTTELVGAGESMPFAFRSLTESGTFAGRSARLVKRFGNFTGATCSFAVKPVQRSGNPMVIIFEGTAPEVQTWSVWISPTPSETRLGGGALFKDGGVSPYLAEFAPTLPTNAWSHLEITVGQSVATLKLEGALVATFQYPATVSTSLIDMKFGVQAYETTEQEYLFDDLRCAVTN
jgi:hypothetical protein